MGVRKLLHIPKAKLFEIAERCSTEEACMAALIQYWLWIDPLASWRRVIHSLDGKSDFERADKIRHYAEDLTGTL